MKGDREMSEPGKQFYLARAAFVAKIKEENYYSNYTKQSLMEN